MTERDAEVIVIGAGTAGLAAAKALHGAGVDTLVLEAAHYVGGRCVTDTHIFQTPFDLGGSWLHSAAINPLARAAETGGRGLHKTPWTPTWVFADGKRLTPPEVAAYTRTERAMWDHIRARAQDPGIRTAADAIPAQPGSDTAAQHVAQMQGADADVVSAQDCAAYEEAEGDWLVEGGLGRFIKGLHSDTPVRLNCPVSKIDTNGRRIAVSTPDGDLEAEQVIVTVSTGVLAAGSIAFVPPLPDAKRAAIAALPMGLLNKVGIEMSPEWTAAHVGQMTDYHKGTDAFCTVLYGFYNSPLAVGFVAGRCADALEAEGPGAATALCLEALQATFGADVMRYVKGTHETAWRSNPRTLGAYSYGLPGAPTARDDLARPIEDRIFFAGEATVAQAYATVHGAFISGAKAADAIIKSRAQGR